jgi:hypothetical protein
VGKIKDQKLHRLLAEIIMLSDVSLGTFNRKTEDRTEPKCRFFGSASVLKSASFGFRLGDWFRTKTEPITDQTEKNCDNTV